MAATAVPRDKIDVSGRVTWFASSANARRGFCAICGSQLFWDGPSDNLAIFAGSLDNPTGLSMAGHIYVADKGDYYDLTDDLPKAAGTDPDLSGVDGA